MGFRHCSINALAGPLLLSFSATSLALAPDPNPQHVYWGAWQIHRANLDGTGVTQVAAPGGPYGSFLINRAAGLLYIVDGSRLWRTNPDGTSAQTIYTFPSDFYNPDVARDPKHNPLFVNDPVEGAIYRVDANGGNPLQIIPPQTGPGGTRHIEEIDFDTIQNKLYWAQWPSGSGMQFRRSIPDGTGIENLFSVSANVSEFALDIGAGKIYWTQFGAAASQGSMSGLWGVAGIACCILCLPTSRGAILRVMG